MTADGVATQATTGFHPLRVAAIDPLTSDAAALTFEVPAALAADYAHLAGQHVTIRFGAGDDVTAQLRRTYSVASPAGSGQLRIGVRRIAGGRMSSWLLDDLRPGDPVSVAPPAGRFVLRPRPDLARHHVLVGAGSGITPLVSILATALAQEPRATATLLYGNRETASVMFLDEVEALKNTHPTRLTVAHVLSREQRGSDLLTGRLDAARVSALARALVPPGARTQWWLCGPAGVVVAGREAAAAVGVRRADVHSEVFHADDSDPAPTLPQRIEIAGGATVRVELAGVRTTLTMQPAVETVLTATLRARPDAPFACTGGVCGTCRARVVSGTVTMDRNYALEPDEVAAGVILACQARPTGDHLDLVYDV